jgi:hypothetical protein
MLRPGKGCRGSYDAEREWDSEKREAKGAEGSRLESNGARDRSSEFSFDS